MLPFAVAMVLLSVRIWRAGAMAAEYVPVTAVAPTMAWQLQGSCDRIEVNTQDPKFGSNVSLQNPYNGRDPCRDKVPGVDGPPDIGPVQHRFWRIGND